MNWRKGKNFFKTFGTLSDLRNFLQKKICATKLQLGTEVICRGL